MSNPYQSPVPAAGQPGYTAIDTGHGWVSQVRIVALLNGVQGLLEIPTGLIFIAAALFLPETIQRDPRVNVLWATGFYVALGTLTLVASGLRIFAAVSNFRFRRRTLGIVSLVGGLASLLSCYCAPTGIALLVYGLIVLLNPAVRAAFAMGDQGLASDEILASFVPYRPAYPPPQWPPK